MRALISLAAVAAACLPFLLIVIAIFLGALWLARKRGQVAEAVWAGVAEDLGLTYVSEPGNVHIHGALDGVPVRVEIRYQRDFISHPSHPYTRTIPWMVVMATPASPPEGVMVLPKGAKLPKNWEATTFGQAQLGDKYTVLAPPGSAHTRLLKKKALDVLAESTVALNYTAGQALWGRTMLKATRDGEELKTALHECARLAAAL